MKPRPAEPVVLSAFGRIISIHELSHFLEICCCTAAHVEFEYQDVCVSMMATMPGLKDQIHWRT
jgi:thymidylate synthase ThyX